MLNDDIQFHVQEHVPYAMEKLMSPGSDRSPQDPRQSHPIIPAGEQHVAWRYHHADLGAENWHINFKLCNGKRKSPINIVAAHTRPRAAPPIYFTNLTVDVAAILRNTGHGEGQDDDVRR